MRVIILAGVLFFVPLLARAEVTVGEYRNKANDPELQQTFHDYVLGVGKGIFWANSRLIAEHRQPLFCQPENLGLDQAVILDLLSQELRKPSVGGSYKDDTPIEAILVRSFMYRFPCQK